jgi:SAM-dependent methyltransferase
MDTLAHSWSSFSKKVAGEYLKTFGYPSGNSKRILVDILKNYAGTRKISIVDLGCGNAQLYEFFKEQQLACSYTGVDFSAPLLEAAKLAAGNDPDVEFIQDDVNELGSVHGKYDMAIYSHVVEILSSPERSLLKAKSFAKSIIIRFFEPPEFESDTVELREMDVGDGKTVPYLRRKMSRDYYRLMLTKIGCKRVDVYRDETAKDQIHVLHYD